LTVDYVDATITMTVGDKAVATRTVSMPIPPVGANVPDRVLEGFVRSAALRILPTYAPDDVTVLRSALEAARTKTS
jgi:hypothetical protein